MTLDETPGNQGGTHDTSDVSATLSALAATLGATAIQTAHTNVGVVAFSYGADGAGSVMLGNANGPAFNGTPSGFTRTSDGSAVLLYTDANNPTILKGMVGNELVSPSTSIPATTASGRDLPGGQAYRHHRQPTWRRVPLATSTSP